MQATADQSLGDRLVQAISSETGFFEALGATNEALGYLCPEAFTKLLDMGVLHALVPSALGGSQLGAVATIELVEALSYADASTGWVAMAIGFCTGAAAAHLPDAALSTIFASRQHSLIAGAGAPTGVARQVAGGYEVTGRWRYGSGIRHAQWAHCGLIIEHDQGTVAPPGPTNGIAYIPIGQVSFEGDWDVIGLRATGSLTYAVEKVFVPADFLIVSSPAPWHRGDRIFSQSFSLPTLMGHCGWAMGVSRRLLDELARHARSNGLKPGTLAADQAFHADYAKLEAQVRAARILTLDAWRRAELVLAAGDALTTRDISLIRLALCHVTQVATDAAHYAFRIAGGVSLRDGPLQRLCRDILAGGQHATSSASVLQDCGRELADLAPDAQWVVNSLK